MRTIQGNSKQLFVCFFSLQHNASRNETEFFIELESEKSVVPVAALQKADRFDWAPFASPLFLGGGGGAPGGGGLPASLFVAVFCVFKVLML